MVAICLIKNLCTISYMTKTIRMFDISFRVCVISMKELTELSNKKVSNNYKRCKIKKMSILQKQFPILWLKPIHRKADFCQNYQWKRAEKLQIWAKYRQKVTNFPLQLRATNGLEKS